MCCFVRWLSLFGFYFRSKLSARFSVFLHLSVTFCLHTGRDLPKKLPISTAFQIYYFPVNKAHNPACGELAVILSFH